MRLRTSAISVAIILLAVVPSASTAHGQSQPEADVISGKWDAVLQIQDNPEMLVKLKLDLKLDGEKVTGTFESSSRLGNGTLHGSWVDNTLKVTLESSHLTPVLTGALQKGKLAGEWDGGQMQGRWEAKKKKDKETRPATEKETHRPRIH